MTREEFERALFARGYGRQVSSWESRRAAPVDGVFVTLTISYSVRNYAAALEWVDKQDKEFLP